MRTQPRAFSGRPFHLRISLAIDAVVIALEATDSRIQRESLRRQKAKLEEAVPRRRYAASAGQNAHNGTQQ